MNILAQSLWKRLNPGKWPISFASLPNGSALVGGAVRDGLMDRLIAKPDLDLVVSSNAIRLAENFAKDLGGKCVILDKERDIARLVINGWTIDIARQIGKTLKEDLFTRDFTINAIALILKNDYLLFDPLGGIDDLKQNLLVCAQEKNLSSDPLRLLRGFRFIAEHDFKLDKQTFSWIKNYANLLPQAAPERIQHEIQRLVIAPWAEKSFSLINQIRLLEFCQGQQDEISDYFLALSSENHLFSKKEISIAFPLVRLVNLLNEDGLVKLRFSKKDQQRCKLLRKWQRLNDGKAYKTLQEFDRLKLHQELEADLPALILALPKEHQIEWLTRWRDPNDPLFHPSSPLDGKTLQAVFQIPPGPQLGQLIIHLTHEKAFGRLQSREDALKTARYWFQHK